MEKLRSKIDHIIKVRHDEISDDECIDLLCEAIGKTAEGMEMLEPFTQADILPLKAQLEDCQAYWKEQIKE